MEFFTMQAKKFVEYDDENWEKEKITSELLQKKLREIVPYSPWDYIRKYVFFKLDGMGKNDIDEIENEEYVKFIEASFENKKVPYLYEGERESFVDKQLKSFDKIKFTERHLALKWCLGLGMDSDEASEFLKKAFRQNGFNFRNPYECILEFVMRTHQDHQKAMELLKTYIQKMDSEDFVGAKTEKAVNTDTTHFESRMRKNENEAELLNSLIELSMANMARDMEKAECYPHMENERDFFENMKNTHFLSNSRLVVYQEVLDEYVDGLEVIYAGTNGQDSSGELKKCFHKKKRNAQKKKGDDPKEKSDEIDYGKVITESLDLDSQRVNIVFEEYKEAYGEDFLSFISNWADYIGSIIVSKMPLLSKDRIKKVVDKERDIDRGEVILLCFLNYLINEFDEDDPYGDFTEYVDEKLEQMGFQEFYLPNPFESFLAVCLLSDDPEETFMISAVLTKLMYGLCPLCNGAVVNNDKSKKMVICADPECISNIKLGKSDKCPVCGKDVIQKVGSIIQCSDLTCKWKLNFINYDDMGELRNSDEIKRILKKNYNV